MDDSHAEFERDPNKILDVANGICELHGLVNTHVSGSLRSGCDECLEQAEEAFVEIKKLNKILMESQIVSSAKAKGTKASIQLKKAIKEREEEIKGLVDLKKEVNKYFDKLHNILEVKESRVTRLINEKQVEALKSVDQISQLVCSLETLLGMVEDMKSPSSGRANDGQLNLAEITKKIVNEEEKAKACLLKIDTEYSPLNLTIDHNFRHVIKSCIYVEEVKLELETPPESSNEEDRERSDIITKLGELVEELAPLIHPASQEVVTDDGKNPFVLENVLSGSSTANPLGIPTPASPGGIIDISQSSESDINPEDEAENGPEYSSLIPDTSVPRNLKIECQVLDIVSPFDITVRSFEDKETFLRLQVKLNMHYNFRGDGNLSARSIGLNDFIAARTGHGWMRGIVVKGNESNKPSRVNLIDLGLVCPIQGMEVQRLDRQFLSTPMLAFNVRLGNLIPLGSGDQWSRAAKLKLKELIEEATTGTVEIEVCNFDKFSFNFLSLGYR